MSFYFKPSTITKLIRVPDRMWSGWIELGTLAIASLTVTGLLLGVRAVGGLQPLELVAYDHLVRSRPQAGPDPRLLVVAITEADIKAQKQWPLSDRVMARVFRQLQSDSPRVIGLDQYRDLPQQPGHAELVAQLQRPNVIAIANIGDSETGGTPPPPGVPKERVGFNDLLLDPDGTVRRNLLFSSSTNDVLYSFSLRVALTYLATQGISEQPSKSNPDYLQLGKAVFVPLEANSGGYQSIDARGYQILLNYRSGHQVARQVSLTQVLNGQVDPSWVRDKVVLVGTTASSLKDLFTTPYSAVEQQDPQLPGVMVQAHMVSQLLSAATGERPLFRFWPEWVEIGWIFVWSVVGGSLAWRIRHPLYLGPIGTAMLGVLSGACFYLFTQRFLWVPVASPVVALVVTAGIMVLARTYQAQRQQRMVMKLLGQNTSPEIAAALWSMRELVVKGKIPGQVLTATMLFTDIKDFSSIAEQMLPEALLDWLNECLNSLVQEVQAHHGIINKFTGDGLMAVFGVPIARTNSEEIAADAQSAIDCALAMSDRLEVLNQHWLSRGLPIAQMRIGIATGTAIAGSLGGKERLEYGVIGDSVNIASRLESCHKDRQPSTCRVLIADATLVHVQGQFQIESWGPVALKGRRQEVEIYRVIGRN